MNDGLYYYASKRKSWGIWRNKVLENGTSYGEFIKEFATKDEARAEVYRLNGWKLNNR